MVHLDLWKVHLVLILIFLKGRSKLKCYLHQNVQSSAGIKKICFQILKRANFQYCVTHGVIRAIIFRIIFYKIKSFFGSTEGLGKDKDLFTMRRNVPQFFRSQI